MHVSEDPARMAVPPPFEFDLLDAGRRVGWVRGGRIVFCGFRDEVEAAHAAWVAHRGLMQAIVDSFGARSAPVEAERLLVVRSEDGAVVHADGRRVALLLPPGADGRLDDGRFGFELRVPSPHDEQWMRATAHALQRELRASHRRWTIFPSVVATRAPVPAAVGIGMRLAMVAVLAVLVALLQPIVAPGSAMRAPLLAVAAAAFGAAGVSELLRRVRARDGEGPRA